MKRHHPRRPSVATATALLALFVALGGTVYAAAKINGRQIAPNSIPGNRIKKGSLTGAEVDASTLGQVPSAARATSAASAGTADTASRAALADRASTAANATTAATADKASNVLAASINAAGEVTAAEQPGTTAAKFGGNTYVVTFNRAVLNCVPVASTSEVTGGEVSASVEGTAHPNEVVAFTTNGLQDFNLVVVC
jgi:hypothetical protein